MFLKASHIITLDGPDLSPGVIHIEGDTIEAVGHKTLLKNRLGKDELIDLTGYVLLPGFVNAHCHLELTSLGPLKVPLANHGAVSFVPWIREIVKKKNLMTEEEMRVGIRDGVKKLLQSGVTTIGDHISFNTCWEEITSSPLRGILFGEVLGLLPEVSGDIYRNLKGIKDRVGQSATLFQMSITPHSAHSVHPDTLALVLRQEPGPLSCHLAESQAEDEYFKSGEGDLARFLRGLGAYSSMKFGSGLRSLNELCPDLSKIMIIHGNYLDDGDLELIKKHHLSIVHCPGSHEYFGHRPFPVKKYLDRGINIALGTDSIASNTELSFLSELKRLKVHQPNLSDREILEMATINGARALKMDQDVGSLKGGKRADIIGLRGGGRIIEFKWLDDTKKVDFMMINGNIISI